MPLLPAVGVVITSFNHKEFVEEAILSAARQTIRDISVVVVDDASTDGSDEKIGKVLERLNDDRFRYVRLESNRGQFGAIRCGLDHLQAPFVSFLDSDDYWYPEFVERQLEAHLNADFPVALSFSDSHIVDSAGRMLAGTAWWFDSNEVVPAHHVVDPAALPAVDPRSGELAYRRNGRVVLRAEWSLHSATNTTTSMMFRRSFIDLVMAPPDRLLPLHVDFYFSTLAALLTGAVAVYDALYAYRMHGNNLHSDGMLHGGAYNSSKREWDPIRTNILRLVQATLQGRADALRRAFGKDRYALAERQLADALEPRPQATGWRGSLRRVIGCL